MDTKRNREEFDDSSLFSYSIGYIDPSEEGQPQWSTVTNSGNYGKGTWTYTIAFSSIYAVMSTSGYDGDTYTATSWVQSKTTTNCTVCNQRWVNASYHSSASPCMNFAIGK